MNIFKWFRKKPDPLLGTYRVAEIKRFEMPENVLVVSWCLEVYSDGPTLDGGWAKIQR